jgi:hypothetical protein
VWTSVSIIIDKLPAIIEATVIYLLTLTPFSDTASVPLLKSCTDTNLRMLFEGFPFARILGRMSGPS